MSRCALSRFALPAAVAFAFSGCHKSSNPAPVPPVQPTNNLAAVSAEVATSQPRIGYPLEVVTNIQVLEATPDVTVSYYALNGQDVANELDEPRQFYLGSATFPDVQVAVTAYRGRITVPPSVTPPGDYVIVCKVDPSDLIAEQDEDDNVVEVATVLAPQADPNVFVQELVLDRQSIVLDPDVDDVVGQLLGDVQNTDAGGTVVVGLRGSLTPVEVEAFVHLRVTRADLPAGSNTFDVPLYLWDSANGRYCDVFGLNGPPEWLSLGEVQPALATDGATTVDIDTPSLTSVHADLYLPGQLARIVIEYIDTGQLPVGVSPVPDLPPAAAQALIAYLSTGQPPPLSALEFSVIVDVRARNPQFVDDDPRDNSAAKPLYVLLPGEESTAPDRPLAFESGLESFWDNDAFGVGFGFDALAAVDGRGAIAEVIGSVPAEAFGNRFDFMRFDARAQVVPATVPAIVGETSGFYLDLEFAGLTVYSYEEDLGYQYDGTFSVVKEKTFAKQFFIGPVPVSASGGVSGEIGYQLVTNLQPTSLASGVRPFATLGASVEAGVGIAGFRAGVGGSLTLIDERFAAEVGTGLTVLPAQPNVFEGSATMQVTNTITGPNGELFLFAEYPGIKWCRRSVLGARVTLPCGIKTITKKANLVAWQTFVKEDVLFEETLCKRVVVGGGTATFAACGS